MIRLISKLLILLSSISVLSSATYATQDFSCFKVGTRLNIEAQPGGSSFERVLQVLQWSSKNHQARGRISDARYRNPSTNRGVGQGCYQYVSSFSGFTELGFRFGNFSPLLLDLNRDGFQFSKRGEGVEYDIVATGSVLPIQWVARGTDDGFLSIDLNGNGLIDDGGELFGEGTKIIESQNKKASNGFVALAQYDSIEHGGNLDGFITSDDAVWAELQLWIDANSNGRTDQDELRTLEHYQILSIPLEPRVVKNGFERFDDSGNLIPYWQWVDSGSSDLPSKIKLIDVFFAGINE